MNQRRLARLSLLASGAALVGAVSLACGKDTEPPKGPIHTNGPDDGYFNAGAVDAGTGLGAGGSTTDNPDSVTPPPDVVGIPTVPAYTNSVRVDPSKYSDAGAPKKTPDAQKQPKGVVPTNGPGEPAPPSTTVVHPKQPLLNSPSMPPAKSSQ